MRLTRPCHGVDIKDVRSLKALLAALRAEGVVRFKVGEKGEIDIVMGDAVVAMPVASATSGNQSAPAPSGPYAEMAAELGLNWDEGAKA